MKSFDSTKLKHTHLFKALAILTNVLHSHQMDFIFEHIGEQMPNLVNHGWDRGF
jgi:hypothetical protein